MGSIRPNLTHVGWVGLGWTYVMGWIGLNFLLPTMVGWVKKFPQPDPTNPCTPLHDPECKLLSSHLINWKKLCLVYAMCMIEFHLKGISICVME